MTRTRGAAPTPARILGPCLALCLASAGCTVGGPSPGTASTPLPTQAPTAAGSGTPDGTSAPVADPVYPDYGNPKIDVRHYDLALAWNPGGRTLSGTATLTIRATTDLTEVALDFSDALTVDSATIDGIAVRAGRRAGDLVLPTGTRIPRNGELRATIRYHGRPRPVAFPGDRADVAVIGAQIAGDGAIYAMQEPYGAFTWFPCNDQPSDEARYDIAITAPTGWAGVASGGLVGTQATDHSVTNRYHDEAPMATYLVAFAVDRFQRHDDRGPHGLPVSYWVRPADWDDMMPTLRQSPAMLAWLERLLGPYPFDSAGVVVVQGRSGMETQTMVTLGPLTGPSAAPVLVHEYAHHWFGDSVTPRTWADVWLNEGFALYLQMVYTVEKLGGDEAETIREWRALDRTARHAAGPPGHYRPDHFAARNVYVGPALMLHEIRHRLGDPAFFAMLHDWAQHHQHTNQDRASFTAWLNAYTGQDLTPIVNRWLDSPSTPA
ncbi:MAG TPA: M1 family metallopeptidase [Micromonosporaceae bacterium]